MNFCKSPCGIWLLCLKTAVLVQLGTFVSSQKPTYQLSSQHQKYFLLVTVKPTTKYGNLQQQKTFGCSIVFWKTMLDFWGGGWGWYPRRLTCYVEDLFRIQLLDIWVVTNQVWIAFLSWVSKFTEVYTSHLPPTSPHPFQANIKSRLLIVGQTLELQWGKFKFMPQRRDSVSHL